MLLSRPLSRRITLALALCAFAAGAGAGAGVGGEARADSIFVASSAGGAALEVPVTSITGIEAGQLLFQTVAGGQSKRAISQIVRLRVDSQPALTAAEEAYQARRFEVATTDYLKAMRSSGNPWVGQWSAPRLLESAQQAGRFDAAATAYIQMMMDNPASAGGVKLAAPTVADAKQTQVAEAVGQTTAALKNPQLSAESKAGLEKFLAELQRIQGASAAPGAAPAAPAVTASARPAASAPPGGSASTGAPAPSAASAASPVQASLDAAAAALARKDFTGAIAAINASRTTFVHPADQARALFILAEAQAGLAETSAAVSPAAAGGNARSSDDARKDAALAYLRVAAQAKDSPLAAPALLKAAAIEEQLKDVHGARTLYQQVAREFANTPAAEQAKQAMSRLAASH
jgi:TolA-binding protein